MKKFLKNFCIVFLTLALFSSKASAAPTFVQDFAVNSQETEPRGLTFNNDGTKMFVIGWTGDDANEYTLSTAWDVSTASFVDSFRVAAAEDDARDVKFNSDGIKMFILGRGKDKVYAYSLSTGFDVSTASSVNNFSVATQEGAANGLEFNTDGTKMFVLGQNGNDVNEYTLTTGFDVSTAKYAGDDGYNYWIQRTNRESGAAKVFIMRGKDFKK